MIKVEKNAKTLDEGIKNLMSGAKQDYVRMSTMGGKELTGYSKEQVDNWDKKTRVMPGKKYIKIVQDTGVFCFIAKEDFKHFKKGDILKAAGYNAPALNSARVMYLLVIIQYNGLVIILKIREHYEKNIRILNNNYVSSWYFLYDRCCWCD